MYKRTQGFTLIELLVVIAIIGVLSTLAIVALGGARQKARDSKRVSDMNQLGRALEVYYSDNGSYPSVITSGLPLSSPDGSKSYLSAIPTNPGPRADGTCPDQDYVYAPRSDGQGYTIYYCLSAAVGQTRAGMNIATESAVNADGSLLLQLDAGIAASYPGSGTTWNDLSGKGNNGTFGAGTSAPTFNSANGGSLLFDNTDLGNDYVQLGNILGGASDFTIIAWVKNSGSGFQTVFGNYPQGMNNGTMQLTWSSNRTPYLYIDPSNVITDTGYHTAAIKQVVIARTGGVTVSSYVNGSLKSSITRATVIYPGNFRIGTNTSGTEPFLGNIYQILVYNRGLSTAEILANYNAQKSRYGL